MMRLLYFAHVREALGHDDEVVDFPVSVHSVSDALDWIVAQSPRHADAFADRSKLRFALDQKMVKVDASLDGASELAIFPPVTGG